MVHVKKVKETETGGKPTFLDSPVLCARWYNSFLIDQVDPIKNIEVLPKPLTPNKNFYEPEKQDDLPF